ncbi:MAG: molybdopterin-dependent oxidoreductase [Stellaceae bacterium]
MLLALVWAPVFAASPTPPSHSLPLEGGGNGRGCCVTPVTDLAAQPGGSLSVGGLVKAPQTLTLVELQSLPWTTVEATFETEHGPQHGTWIGVSLWTLLDQSGGLDAPAKEAVRHWLTVTGRDGYSVVLSVGEIDPSFGHAAAVVAWSRDGQPFDPKAGLRLILPGDRRGGRDARNVVSIEVK